MNEAPIIGLHSKRLARDCRDILHDAGLPDREVLWLASTLGVELSRRGVRYATDSHPVGEGQGCILDRQETFFDGPEGA